MNVNTATKISILIAASLLLAVLHFAVGTHTHPLHIVHVVLGALSLLPVLAGAVWFGVGGGTLTALIVSALYFIHMRLSWPNQPMENVNQMAMIAVYFFVGIASGVLVTMQEAERRHRLAVEQTAQRQAIVQGFTSLCTALGWRDEYTLRHSQSVAQLSVELGKRRGMRSDRLELLRLAALMHDVGKIGVSDDILLKREKLTEQEAAQMRRHPYVAGEILRGIQGTEEIAVIVMAHHERLNGTGYPAGLLGPNIPMEAQILSVADIYCALTESRPYKPSIMTPPQAMQIIEPMAGVELDARTVASLREIVSSSASQRAAA